MSAPTELHGRSKQPRLTSVHIPLSRPAVPMPSEFLCYDGVARVLQVARNELVTNRVPRQALAAAVVHLREAEQLAPHPLEILDGPTVLRPEHVGVRIPFERKPTLRQFCLE